MLLLPNRSLSDIEIQQMGKYWNVYVSGKITINDTIKNENTCIRNTIMAWVKVTKSNVIQKDLIFMRETAMDREFKPTLNDNIFKNWESKDLT